MRLLLAALCALAAGSVPAIAHACSMGGVDSWQVDPRELGVDVQPPTAPELRSVRIVRAVEPLLPGDVATSCAGTIGVRANGEARIRFTPSTDDRTPQERIGYRVRIEGARPPARLMPQEWIEPVPVSGELVFWWNETDDDELLDFRVQLTPLDSAGNEGPALVVPIRDEGVGCSAGGGGAGLAGLLAVVALLAVRRRG